MDFQKALQVVDTAVVARLDRHLKDIEVAILQGTWQGQKYHEIAEAHGYTPEYLNNDIGPGLWKSLSEALGEKVSKTNFRAALERRSGILSNGPAQSQAPPLGGALDFPEGPVVLNSRFYIERPPLEALCYEAILQPGALIRIKAPRHMGKTSLLDRVIANADQQNYQIVRLNLLDVGEAKFSNLNDFLRWFCADVSLQLQLPNQLDDYWNEAVIGSLLSCKTYFQLHILEQVNSPLVLAFDEVDRVFQYPQIASGFFPLLRSWHEEANNREVWKKLRLVLAHSTEDYGPLDINQSPFNVGLPVELTEFTTEQVQALASRHEFKRTTPLATAELASLQALVGGHPYLVRLALDHLARQGGTMEQLLHNAATNAGIYQAHLRRHLVTLKAHPTLADTLKQIVGSTEPILVETLQEYKLCSMGLIKRIGDQVMSSCELYQRYFRARFQDEF